ncbi:hypothetical protein ELS19_18045 [Halogeometricum borinquense]|uniref:Halocin C8 n=1 Tax=Halogeometricum borinquense TaxID=60847 RepID=A0A482T755_9EURY|nr:hypothetical protein [Halogeometricum borinquense]RYJ08435.1 hypothetical protein ELS19_18045 [Halogeometricum borinquense]
MENESPSKSDFKRRNVLKKMGGIGVGSVAIYSGGAKAKSDSGMVHRDSDRAETLETVLESDKYQEFVEQFSETYSAKPNVEKSQSLQVTSPEDKKHDIWNIPTKGIPESDKSGITAIVKDDSVKSVEASSTKSISESTKVVTSYKLSEGSIETTEQTVQLDEKSGSVSARDSSMSTMAASSTECEVCKFVFNSLLAVGCDAAVGTVCAGVGVAVSGGTASSLCFVIVPVICNNTDNLSPYSAEELCSGEVAGTSGEIGYC